MKPEEKAMLGYLLNEKSPRRALAAITGAMLKEEDFGSPEARSLFSAAYSLFKRDIPPDAVSLAREMHGELTVDIDLLPSGVTAEQFRGHTEVVMDEALRRNFKLQLKKAGGRADDLTVPSSQLLAEMGANLAMIASRTSKVRSGDEIARESLADWQRNATEGVSGYLKSGIRPFDDETGGFPVNLTLIGGAPGVGKGALIATCIANWLDAGVNVGFHSLEDKGDWLIARLVARKTGMSVRDLKEAAVKPKLHAKIIEGYKTIEGTLGRLFINDADHQTSSDIVAASHDMVLNRGCRVIVLDHLGEVMLSRESRNDSEARTYGIGRALADIRSIYKTHNVPVIVTAHMHRAVSETTEEEVPDLSQFADSTFLGKMCRLGLCLRRWGTGPLRIDVLKNTNGKSGVNVEVGFHHEAGLLFNK